jgi:hypothetical protein
MKCLIILIKKASGKSITHDYKQHWSVYSHELSTIQQALKVYDYKPSA